MTMRRGFTLIETLVAGSVGLIVLAAISGLILSVWMLTKGSSDQLQGALRARYVRERYYYNLMEIDGRAYGFINATNVFVYGNEVIAQFKDGRAYPSSAPNSQELDSYLDFSGAHEYQDDDKSLQYVYIAVPLGKATYYDRIVVPVFGRYTDGVNDMVEVKEAFGASH